MHRLLTLTGVLAVCAGCQVQNPFAAFGPARVPPPNGQTPSPYYPGATPSALASKPAGSTLPSVSAEPAATPSAPQHSFVVDSADREPIRIVENPAAISRTASAPQRNPLPSAAPGLLAPPPPQAESAKPPAPSLNGKSSSLFRSDPAVAPAAYQQPAGSFSSAPPSPGTWRAR